MDVPQEFALEAGREREAREVAQDSALVRALGLAPKLVEVCVAHGPDGLALEPVIRRKLPALWVAQQEMIAVALSV